MSRREPSRKRPRRARASQEPSIPEQAESDTGQLHERLRRAFWVGVLCGGGTSGKLPSLMGKPWEELNAFAKTSMEGESDVDRSERWILRDLLYDGLHYVGEAAASIRDPGVVRAVFEMTRDLAKRIHPVPGVDGEPRSPA